MAKISAGVQAEHYRGKAAGLYEDRAAASHSGPSDAELIKARFCQLALISPALAVWSMSPLERERDNVRLEAVDDSAGLLSRAPMRLINDYGLSGLGLPILDEGVVDSVVRLRGSGRKTRSGGCCQRTRSPPLGQARERPRRPRFLEASS